MRAVWAVFILSMIFTKTFAQDVMGLPVLFNQFTRTYFLINPASIGNDSDLEVSIGRQFNTDEWSNIYTHYANINLELTPKRKADHYSHHTLGLTFIGDKEGDYLSRTRAYALYNAHIMLSEKISLAAGASLGVASYAVKGTAVSPSGAATSPDGSVGLWLYDANGSHAGLSVNQLAESKLTPIVETTRLVRHYNISLRKALSLNAHLSLYPALLVRYVPQYSTTYEAATTLVMNELFSVGAAGRYKNNISVMAGLERIPAFRGYAKTAFSYTFPAGKQVQANFNTYEFTLSFFLKKKEKEEPTTEEEN